MFRRKLEKTKVGDSQGRETKSLHQEVPFTQEGSEAGNSSRIRRGSLGKG